MAGSVCPEPLMRRVVEDMYMKDITICYGLTEGSPVMTQSDPDDPLHLRCETVGCAMPGIEVRIGDPETCEELPRGEVGEILCRGYNVMKGYYNMPEETARTISPDGWLHSGDLGTMDENGYVRVTGRIKDMIIRGGENVYPREIEEFLMGMPGVLDIQGVAVPSRKYGEEVGAFILALSRRARGARRRARLLPRQDRLVQDPALHRRGGRLPPDRQRQDPEVQAARDGRRALARSHGRAGPQGRQVA